MALSEGLFKGVYDLRSLLAQQEQVNMVVEYMNNTKSPKFRARHGLPTDFADNWHRNPIRYGPAVPTTVWFASGHEPMWDTLVANGCPRRFWHDTTDRPFTFDDVKAVLGQRLNMVRILQQDHCRPNAFAYRGEQTSMMHGMDDNVNLVAWSKEESDPEAFLAEAKAKSPMSKAGIILIDEDLIRYGDTKIRGDICSMWLTYHNRVPILLWRETELVQLQMFDRIQDSKKTGLVRQDFPYLERLLKDAEERGDFPLRLELDLYMGKSKQESRHQLKGYVWAHSPIPQLDAPSSYAHLENVYLPARKDYQPAMALGYGSMENASPFTSTQEMLQHVIASGDEELQRHYFGSLYSMIVEANS